jgi:two-component system nitrate/nitrite sensor histidine kinase NarX
LVLALQARERHLDAILGGLEPFLTVDDDWRLTFVNKAAAAMAGASPDELVGRDLRELGDEDGHPETWAVLRRAMESHAGAEYEESDEQGRTYLGKVYPIADGGLAIYVRDVSEAKRRELERDELFSALELSEQSFSAVFEASPFAMSLTEMPTARITRVNRAFEQLSGYSRAELVGSTSTELGLADPDSQAEVARRFAADGVVREFEVQRATRDGEARTLSINLDRVTIGQRAYVLASIHDVSERAQAEAALRASQDALRASEERYRDIVETTGDGIMIGDPDGIIVFANRRMAEMLGYDRDELVGVHGFDLIFPDWKPAVIDNRAALEEGEVVRGEFKLRRRDGTPIWTLFSSTPMTDREGRHVGNLTMHSDITELKAAEQARRESDETLRSFYDSAPFVIGVARVEGARTVVVSGNRALGEFLERDPADIAVSGGVELSDTPEVERALVAAYRESRAVGRPVQFEQTLTRGGKAVTLSFTVAQIGSRPGGAALFSFVAEDVTERRRAERVLRESELAAVAQEERSHLARDLHDSVTQALFAASLKAEALTLHGGVSPEVDDLVGEVRRLTGGALAQMRAMLLELRGEPLESIPIRQLLRNVVEATESRTLTRVELTVEGSVTVPADLHVALYRITQEALNNVVRHAQAERAWVRLQLEPSAVRLTVGDDGRGFDAAPAGPTHLGLRSMRERAAEVGAAFRLTTAPGRGTEIGVEWRPPSG